MPIAATFAAHPAGAAYPVTRTSSEPVSQNHYIFGPIMLLRGSFLSPARLWREVRGKGGCDG
jgi:hypothetical protein